MYHRSQLHPPLYALRTYFSTQQNTRVQLQRYDNYDDKGLVTRCNFSCNLSRNDLCGVAVARWGVLHAATRLCIFFSIKASRLLQRACVRSRYGNIARQVAERVLHDATLKNIVAIVAESRTRFYFVQRLMQLVSQVNKKPLRVDTMILRNSDNLINPIIPIYIKYKYIQILLKFQTLTVYCQITKTSKYG